MSISSDGNMNALVTQMKMLADQAQNVKTTNQNVDSTTSFKDVLAQKLNDVNDAMVHSADLQERFVKMDPNITLPQVKVASEKSEIYFNFTMEVRNKAIAAYNELMNMPV